MSYTPHEALTVAVINTVSDDLTPGAFANAIEQNLRQMGFVIVHESHSRSLARANSKYRLWRIKSRALTWLDTFTERP